MKLKLAGIGGVIAAGILAGTLLPGQPITADYAKAYIEEQIASLQQELDYLENQRPSALATQKNRATQQKAELETVLAQLTVGAQARQILDTRVVELDRSLSALDEEETTQIPGRVGELRAMIAQLQEVLAQLQ